MKDKKFARLATLVTAVAVTATAGLLAACGGGSDDGSSETYTITYTTEEISGNVRHTGYLTAMSAIEENTVILNDDGTYEYTKYVTTDTDDSTAETGTEAYVSASLLSDTEEDDGLLFSWEAEGTCTLDFYEDGTYVFGYPYSDETTVTESGTWTWESWTLTVTTAGGSVFTGSPDASTYAITFTYYSDMSEYLYDTFTVSSDVWGAAWGATGSYTPVTSSDVEELFSWEAEGTCTLVFYNDGTYVFGYPYSDDTTVTESGTWTWESWVLTVTTAGGSVFTGSPDASTYAITFTYYSDMSEYLYDTFTVSSDVWGAAWGATGSYTPTASSGSSSDSSSDSSDDSDDGDTDDTSTDAVYITYTFYGTYTENSDGTVTLSAAESCNWTEDWGVLEGQGFNSASGTESDTVYPKGSSSSWFLPLDHFSGGYWYAPTSATEVTNNNAVTIELDSSAGTFSYVEVSVFD